MGQTLLGGMLYTNLKSKPWHDTFQWEGLIEKSLLTPEKEMVQKLTRGLNKQTKTKKK